jgi:hypothetical protein
MCVYVYMCMCVCVCVCMYVCTYVRMYVCMYVRTYVCMYVRMYIRMYVRMSVCLSVGLPTSRSLSRSPTGIFNTPKPSATLPVTSHRQADAANSVHFCSPSLLVATTDRNSEQPGHSVCWPNKAHQVSNPAIHPHTHM